VDAGEHVAETFPDNFREKSAEIPVLDCQRTFWEKVTLLHAENHRPDPNKLKPRMARHWSDVAVMSTAERLKDDKLSLYLLDQVIRFKKAISPRIGRTTTPPSLAAFELCLTNHYKRSFARTTKKCKKCFRPSLSPLSKFSKD
jgi:nucleotidyltransferase AbiEii toxin of type IV toxin-antitoxin system